MPLARTPPQIVARSSRQHTFSPSQAYPDPAFSSQNPRVMHSPVGGQPSGDRFEAGREAGEEEARLEENTESHPPEESKEDEDDAMDVEEDLFPPSQEAMAVDEPVRATTPPPVPTEAPTTPGPEPVTPSRRLSRLSRARQSLGAHTTPAAIELDAEIQPSPTPSPPPATPKAAPRTPAAQTPHEEPEESEEEIEEPIAGPSTVPVTPSRRLSRAHRERTPAQVLAEPAAKIADVGEAEYGKYYEALVRTLKINVVDRGLSRLSLEQMKECYPLLAAEKPEMFENVWTSMLHELRDKTLTGAMKLIEDYRIPRRLQAFGNMMDEARAWAAEHPGEGRPDAWRPDATPFVLSAGANLELYDENWGMLRDEYRQLVDECSERAARIESKRAQLAALDNGVSDSVVEIAKTNEVLKHFPTPEMLEWAETIEIKLGSRKE